MLENCLNDPKVTIRRCDARVAAALYQQGSFDSIIDNLGILGWVGSTNIRSVQYFRLIDRTLSPGGIYICQILGTEDAQKAICASMSRVFEYIYIHSSGMCVASHSPIIIDEARAETVVAARAKRLQITELPYSKFITDTFKPVPVEIKAGEPVSDEWLHHEFHYKSFFEFLRQ